MSTPGLYIHIPFCQSKCPYCAFYSIASRALIPRWIDALNREASHYKDAYEPFDSLYFGGGTPTFLETGALSAVIDKLFDRFAFIPDAEITIEANPNHLTREKIKALKSFGINRISVGVQSFDERILAFLGRGHTARQAKDAVTALRTAGFKNIGLDLMYGFQKQAMDEWIDTLKQALLFEPEHLSCYQLSIEKQTLFGRMRDQGRLMPLTENEEARFFLATSQFLEANGYIHYEVSSFAREEVYYSLHNNKYWQHTPYLGLGPSAHSFNGAGRWWNIQSVRKYCETLEEGKIPIDGYEDLSEAQLRLESIALGLRTRQGLGINKIPRRHRSNGILSGLRDSGFLQIKDGRVTPTRKGFLVADHLAYSLSD
ncbi:MAG: radical SAM family heme chaperone HemW [Desulfobacterales bacterium]|nr:radical SAM family heme chaperone HemW [Desulfobacterales bacterium]